MDSITFVSTLSVVWFLLIIAAFGFWIWSLTNCLKRDFRKSNDKIMWVIVLLFLNFLGSILYYFMVYKKEKKIEEDYIS